MSTIAGLQKGSALPGQGSGAGHEPGEATSHRALWREKNPWIAGLLAFLVPGAGHFYQGRWFKGVIYFFCILGIFITGLRLGEGAVVYHKGDQRLPTFWYATQLLTGAIAIPAYFQGQRAASPSNRPLTLSSLSDPITIPFTGELLAVGPGKDGVGGPAKGTLTIGSERTAFDFELTGRFKGTVNQKEVELPLGGTRFMMSPAIGGGPGRNIEVSVGRSPNEHPDLQRLLVGTTPRSFLDSFEAPPDQATLNEIYRRLGPRYDLAVVFTLIAGLLNLFAIWDCVEGPAYGFGDEQPRPRQTSRSSGSNQAPPVNQTPEVNPASGASPANAPPANSPQRT